MQVRVCHSSLLLLFVGLFLSGIVVAPAHAQSAPQISSISPTLGGVGAAAYVYGSNFGSTQGTSTVTFNGTAGTPSYWSNTQINVPVPSGATTGPVVVTVNGAASNGITFTVNTTPNLTQISPTLGGVGAAAYVYGSNFGSTQGTSTVTFNGTAGTPSYWSNTQINVPVPSGATTGPVVVTVNGAASNGVTFTVTGPVITGLSTYSGVVGASITLTGTNFGASQGSSTVSFNGLPAMPT